MLLYLKEIVQKYGWTEEYEWQMLKRDKDEREDGINEFCPIDSFEWGETAMLSNFPPWIDAAEVSCMRDAPLWVARVAQNSDQS